MIDNSGFCPAWREKEWVPESNSTLSVKHGEEYVRDTFLHEQNLMVSDGGVNVLFTGCSHCGILNILEQCEQRTGIVPDRIIGGFHLLTPVRGKASSRPFGKDCLPTCASFRPCTIPATARGWTPFEQLHAMMGNKVRYMGTGAEIVL